MRRLTPETLRMPEQPIRLGDVSAPVVFREPVAHVDETKQALQAAFEEARSRGYAEGVKAAARELDKRVEQIANKLKQEQAEEAARLEDRSNAMLALSRGMAESLERFAKDVEAVSVEVAYAGLVRLLGSHAERRELLQMHCLAVIHEYGDPPATLKVGERDLDLLDLSKFSFPVEVDRRLAPGQCMLETHRGQFDCGLDTRLEAIRQALLSGLHDHQGVMP